MSIDTRNFFIVLVLLLVTISSTIWDFTSQKHAFGAVFDVIRDAKLNQMMLILTENIGTVNLKLFI